MGRYIFIITLLVTMTFNFSYRRLEHDISKLLTSIHNIFSSKRKIILIHKMKLNIFDLSKFTKESFMPHGYTVGFNNYNQYITPSSELLDIVNSIMKKYNTDSEILEAFLAFSQSVPYKLDPNGAGDWVKFPNETLFDFNGDCEDKAILFMSLVMIFNDLSLVTDRYKFGLMILDPTDETNPKYGCHAVAVINSKSEGKYIEIEHEKFYIADGTSGNATIGYLHNGYDNHDRRVYLKR